ncbi:hypothetical protein [Streptosporangium carneum]|uniref:Secreted protein n=1 Tax=Streptosporangium carneum TaxID=47481 RepID=A0A9W6I9W1_9ACTN|nr:hypothetical protein [Streptosporangium carneum]GLK14747.1 hypothetical protein GCM10017600_81590 [Streptosporangium carneum]
MRHLPTLLAAAAAGTLALACAGPASAASGAVRLYSQDGQVETVTDPQRGVCHRGFGANSAVVNQTEGTILIFPDPNCRTRTFNPVDPGEAKHGNIGSFLALD